MTDTVDQRVEIARDYLQGARQRDVQHLPPTRLMVEVAETRHQLAQVLAAVGQAVTLTHEQAATVLGALRDAAVYRSGDADATTYRALAGEISGQLARQIRGQS